ncbi:MAG TPA: hypothetical protein CFH84_04240 [Sulfurimonas sp. UBA12504]|nr:MAG: hypothetical protein A2019_03255 [Sulfurimonas sp. GWF2_37_8]DAB30415.1 MAG TPA: hypothetical protein CFH84_04240 [Sulfurimonas sp. UBA12504]
MIQKISLFLFVALSAHAYNLSEILDVTKRSHSANTIKELASSKIADEALVNSYEAPKLGLSSAHARTPVENGMEYGVSFSQNIAKPFAAEHKENASKYAIKAIEQKTQHELHILNLEVTSRYHNACVAKEMSSLAQLLFDEQNRRVGQLQSAYELGEISKQNLLFHKLDLAKLTQKLNFYKRSEIEKRSYLNESVDNLIIETLACDDLVGIKKDVKLGDIEEHGEMQEMASLQNATDALLYAQQTPLSSLGYDLMYHKELDTTRYTFGVSIPLDFVTSEQELHRKKYLSLSSALQEQKAAIYLQIQQKSYSRQLKIETLFNEYMLYKEEIVPMSLELKELSKLAQKSGEGTLMEHLDSSRSYTQNVLEMLEIKQKYYDELFELYKTADLSIGENCATID